MVYLKKMMVKLQLYIQYYMESDLDIDSPAKAERDWNPDKKNRGLQIGKDVRGTAKICKIWKINLNTIPISHEPS